MKKCTIYALAVIMTLSLFTGCMKAPSGGVPHIKIGVTLYKQDDTFISTMIKNIEKLAKEYEASENIKITVDFADGCGSQITQNDQVDNFIKKKYDILCVNMVDRTAAAVIVDKAKAANIPLIFFNREPVEEDIERWDKVYYVGAITKQSGMLQGKIVVDTYLKNPELVDLNKDGKLQYIMLEGEPGHQDSLIRTEYSVKTITESGINIEKILNVSANWHRGQASAKATQWIKDFSDTVEVVISNNDDMALGVIDAYTAAKVKLPPVIVGVDATPQALEAVKEGKLTGTVVNESKRQSKAILDLSLCLWGKKDLKKIECLNGHYVFIPHREIIISNVQEEIDLNKSVY